MHNMRGDTNIDRYAKGKSDHSATCFKSSGKLVENSTVYYYFNSYLQ